jgi:hypothetical protein
MQDISKKIVVSDQNKILMLQEEFNKAFPYLKIEFFSVSNKQGEHIVNKFTTENNRILGRYRVIHNDEQIIITPEITIATLEKQFNKIYGLGTQVLRKSGKTWLETTLTNAWTLEEQNHQGEALSKNIN